MFRHDQLRWPWVVKTILTGSMEAICNKETITGSGDLECNLTDVDAGKGLERKCEGRRECWKCKHESKGRPHQSNDYRDLDMCRSGRLTSLSQLWIYEVFSWWRTHHFHTKPSKNGSLPRTPSLDILSNSYNIKILVLEQLRARKHNREHGTTFEESAHAHFVRCFDLVHVCVFR